MTSPYLQLGDKHWRNLGMTATPVLYIKRSFGIYVISSSKPISRTGAAPGCLHAAEHKATQGMAHPDLNVPTLQLSSKTPRGNAALPFQSHACRGAAIPAHLDGGTAGRASSQPDITEHPPAPAVPTAAGLQSPVPLLQRRAPLTASPVHPHSGSQRCSFFLLCFMKRRVHLLSAINKK